MEVSKPHASYYDRMQGKEKKMKRASPDYLERVQKDQDHIDFKMRGILVDWLVEVANFYNLLSDTLYLAVSVGENSNRAKDAAFGGFYSFEDCIYITITADTYEIQEVVKMEMELLKSLEYELGTPTTKSFLQELKNYNDSSSQLEMLTCYLGELSLLEYRCLNFPPSLVACCCFVFVEVDSESRIETLD